MNPVLTHILRRPFWPGVGVMILLGMAYVPGLHGPFLFDDFANLPALGSEGRVHDLASFLRYITSGNADPTGRPLAMLTFLIDANDWPAGPFAFKRTNLVLHLVNGFLLATLLRRLGNLLPATEQQTDQATRIDYAALLGATFWLVHPLFVSTTLYVVQREAMLPATTTLLGLLIWLSARKHFNDGRYLSGYAIMLGFVCMTLLGVLAKANGILLPFFMLTIETCLQSPSFLPKSKPYRASLVIFGVMPSLAVVGYLAYQGWRRNHLSIGYSSMDHRRASAN